MRMMVKFLVPVEKGNEAITDGSLAQTMESLIEELEPEAVYFWPVDGMRGGMIVFDMVDSSQIPQVAEPLFMNIDAEVEFSPIMNMDDLKKGITKALQ